MLQLLWIGATISIASQWMPYPISLQLSIVGYIVIVCSLLGAIINRLDSPKPQFSSRTWESSPVTLYGRTEAGEPVMETVKLKGTEPVTLKGPWK